MAEALAVVNVGKKGVAVHKADSVIANPVHRRRVGGIYRSSAQAIEDEDHDIMRHACRLAVFVSEKKVEDTGQAAAAATQQDQNLFHRNSSKPKFKLWANKLSCVDAVGFGGAGVPAGSLFFSSNPNTRRPSPASKVGKMPAQTLSAQGAAAAAASCLPEQFSSAVLAHHGGSDVSAADRDSGRSLAVR